MTEVVVFPQSGYANRLQAIASTALLAESIGASWHVCWEPQAVAPAAPGDIFDSTFVRDRFVTSEHARERWGLSKQELPLYLTHDDGNDRVVLAGHDRGEQAFMPDLRSSLERHRPAVLAIIAGGKFTLDGDAVLTTDQAEAFREERSGMYDRIAFSAGIEQAALKAIADRGPFLGLHLRYSDRSVEAPWSRVIGPALRRVHDRTGLSSVFVASDTGRERDRWLERLTREDLEPWSLTPVSSDRSDPASAFGALVDWRILTRSSGMVYFAASSFAEEAAVASGSFDAGIGLPPSPTRAAWVKGTEYVRAALTYPARHGWGQRPRG